MIITPCVFYQSVPSNKSVERFFITIAFCFEFYCPIFMSRIVKPICGITSLFAAIYLTCSNASLMFRFKRLANAYSITSAPKSRMALNDFLFIDIFVYVADDF